MEPASIQYIQMQEMMIRWLKKSVLKLLSASHGDKLETVVLFLFGEVTSIDATGKKT
jgi:hypothetical protein